MIRQLIQSTNRGNEIHEKMMKIWKAELEWKQETDEVKKDRTKDLHPSIKNMIENASATERDSKGELCNNFLSL